MDPRMGAAGQLRLDAPAPAQGTETFRQPTGTAGGGRRRLIPLRELERWVEREAVSIRR